LRTLVILEDSSTQPFGGGQRVTLEVLKALRCDFDITLFDFAGDSRFLSEARPYVRATLPLPSPSAPRLNRGRIGRALTAIMSLRSCLRVILPSLENQRIEIQILYATTTRTLLLAYLLSLIKGVRYVFHAHLIYTRTSLFRWVLIPAFQRAALILCVSRAVMQQLLGNCYLFYNGVTLRPCQLKAFPSTRIIVATFSNLVKFKGIRYFMESYHLLKHSDMVEYRIYGDGREHENLSPLENECVRLMGFAEDVPALLASEISLVVIPSLIAEACPMALLEALSFGVPVIGTNRGGLAELLKDNETGFLVEPRDPAAIAAKIDYLIDHPDVYRQFSANALEHAKQFDLERYKETVRELFQSL
jgi:glycosyltransferase involved in cell wall biosynthesis